MSINKEVALFLLWKVGRKKNVMGKDKGNVFEAYVYIYKAYHCLSLKQFSHLTLDASSTFTVPTVILGDWFIEHIGMESISLLLRYFCECSIMPFKIYLEFTVMLIQAFCDVRS